ncbi:MAG: hypothetical protein LBV28_03095 [Puniceicoccales bacterium]|jgi:hypothetical protein|nr:hypothetical protein [Puniceicoccales bacterium]
MKFIQKVLPAYRKRIMYIRYAIESGSAFPRDFGGKRLLHRARELASVPLGRRWRLLFWETPQGWRFFDFQSHEEYNKLKMR